MWPWGSFCLRGWAFRDILQSFKSFKPFKPFKGLRPGKRQAWTPIRSHWCGLGVPGGCGMRHAKRMFKRLKSLRRVTPGERLRLRSIHCTWINDGQPHCTGPPSTSLFGINPIHWNDVRCSLNSAGPRLRSSGAHWARRVPGWGPAVLTELGRSQVEVQQCPLRAEDGEELGEELARQKWTWTWRQRWWRRRRRKRRRRRRTRRTTSNNPHLAGGE